MISYRKPAKLTSVWSSNIYASVSIFVLVTSVVYPQFYVNLDLKSLSVNKGIIYDILHFPKFKEYVPDRGVLDKEL